MNVHWVGFDADDTLWEKERLQRHARARFKEVLAAYGVPPARAGSRVDQIEIRNLGWYGYGAMSFGFSLIEAAVERTPFLMVGNWLKSDGPPVVELGGWAVHVPCALTCAHEQAEVPAALRDRFHQIGSLTELPGWVGDRVAARAGLHSPPMAGGQQVGEAGTAGLGRPGAQVTDSAGE